VGGGPWGFGQILFLGGYLVWFKNLGGVLFFALFLVLYFNVTEKKVQNQKHFALIVKSQLMKEIQKLCLDPKQSTSLSTQIQRSIFIIRYSIGESHHLVVKAEDS
jgi:hypothetical protein